MNCAAIGFWVWTGLALSACGGRVTRQESGQSGDGGDKAAASANQGATPSTSGLGDPNTELGECVLGPAEGSVSSRNHCAWVADGRCYEQREMACNCACPHSHDSHCVSGFDAGADGRVEVDCF